MGKFIDLTGQKFGKLTVIERAENYIYPNGKGIAVQWLCNCDCGNKNIIVASASLRKGLTKSCGCMKSEVTYQIKKKYNQYNLSGEYGIGYTSKGEEFYFDLEDYDLIKNYCWNLDKRNYVVANTSKKDGKKTMISFHRLILNFPENMIIDHINHNTNDNRKNNLRICTSRQNHMNYSIKNNNTSGSVGVIWDKRNKKWMAYIGVDYKQYHLGYFENFDDAVKARKEAEEKYFGEFAPIE